jgi:hypothetical protein
LQRLSLKLNSEKEAEFYMLNYTALQEFQRSKCCSIYYSVKDTSSTYFNNLIISTLFKDMKIQWQIPKHVNVDDEEQWTFTL